MTLVMEKTELHAADTTTTTPSSFELKVEIGTTAAFAFLLDPSGEGSGPEHFRRGRKRLPRYFDWLEVPSERALSVVDELMPRQPELLSPLPFNLLVSPRWAGNARSVEVFVNMASRRHNESLVRVPAWAKFLIGHQPVERWIALQPYLARLGKVALIGVDTSSTGEHALEVLVRADDFQAEHLKRFAMLAGAPSGQLVHLWRSLSASRGSDSGPTILSIRLAGDESLDVGVTFPARRAGSAIEIQKRIQALAHVYDLDISRYLKSIEELKRLSGRPPQHTVLGLSSKNGRIVLTASFESVAAHHGMARVS